MRVLITGGRDFADIARLEETLNLLHASNTIKLLIHGAAKGADTLASQWAIKNGVEELACPADWKRFGRGAGPLRNRQMLDHSPDLLVAFPGGSGTADMINAALKRGVAIRHA